MKIQSKTLFACMLAGIFSVSAPVSFAQKNTANTDDPARWMQPDVTPQQYYKTARTEAAAALRENISSCADLKGRDKAACIKEARALYAQDVAEAKRLLSDATAR